MRIKMLRLDEILHAKSFKDGIHLTWAANETIVQKILQSIGYLPNAWFDIDQILPNLKDDLQFPTLNKKRSIPLAEPTVKMPKFQKTKTVQSFPLNSWPASVQPYEETQNDNWLVSAPDRANKCSPNQSCKEYSSQNTRVNTEHHSSQPIINDEDIQYLSSKEPIPSLQSVSDFDSKQSNASQPIPIPCISPDSVQVVHNRKPAVLSSSSPTAEPDIHKPSLPEGEPVSVGNNHGFNLHEIAADLFSEPIRNGSFCQSISKDCAMRKGVATQFKETFNLQDKDSLKQLANKNGVGGVAITASDRKGDFVYNLITKENCYLKPILVNNLRKSIRKMRNHARAHNVRRINMPRISSGLDGLNWRTVKGIILEIFGKENLEIFVYYSKDKSKPESISEQSPQPECSEQSQSESVSEEASNGYKNVITHLRKELKASNEVIEVLQKAIRNDGSKDVEKVSENTRELINSGDITYSNLYSCMVDMESEIKLLSVENEKLSNKISEAQINPEVGKIEESREVSVLNDGGGNVYFKDTENSNLIEDQESKNVDSYLKEDEVSNVKNSCTIQ